MLIYQESHLIIRNTKHIWRQLLDLLLAINFNLMEQLAAKEAKEQKLTAEWNEKWREAAKILQEFFCIKIFICVEDIYTFLF